MNEIKSINTIHNYAVLVATTDESKEHVTGTAFFIPKNKLDEWLVDINYNPTDENSDYNIQHINGTITFLNSRDSKEKIEFDFCDSSIIVHEENHDEIRLDINNNPNFDSIDLNIFYDESKNTIINQVAIETNSINKITDNKSFIDYDNLKLKQGIIEGSLTPELIQNIQEDGQNCVTLISFTTDYYYNNYIDFNPWHGFHN